MLGRSIDINECAVWNSSISLLERLFRRKNADSKRRCLSHDLLQRVRQSVQIRAPFKAILEFSAFVEGVQRPPRAIDRRR